MKKQNKPSPAKETAPAATKGSKTVVRIPALVLTLVALIVVYGALLLFESDYLYRTEELNLFLYTSLYFKQQMVVAGGMLTYLGTYFMQFFYHPWLGSLLLCLWVGLLMWLVKRTFRVSDAWGALLLVPAALVLVIDFDLGYWIYYMKLRGYLFVPVMGTSLALALTWAYRAASSRPWLSWVVLMLAGIGGYPVAGCYALFAVLLMAVITWRLKLTTGQRAVATLLAVLTIIFVPLIYYRTVYYQAMSDNVWWQALPVFKMEDDFSTLYYPYILLAVVLLLMGACYGLKLRLRLLERRFGLLLAQVLVILAVACGTYAAWFKDESFHEEIQMTNCVDRQDWEGVLTVMRNHDGEPTRMMVMYKNLALFRLGRAGNEMYTYRDGSRKPAAPFELRVAQIGGKNVYLYYGLPNYCYRWCLEDGVEYGWRVEHLKFLVRCSILNGEPVVAKKYIDLLKQTRYHGEWTRQYEPLLTDNGTELAKHQELGPVKRLMEGQDQLASDQSLIELFMLNSQAYRTTNDPKVAELVLLSALQLKDIATFWRAFFQYANLHVNQPMPRHFQEAAYLYGHLEHNVDISRMPFDLNVQQDYDGFMQMAQQFRGMSEEKMKEVFYPRYGGTFYYNYFLLRNLRTY